MSTRTITRYAFLLALALILNFVESMIPIPFMFPGAKLGLANGVGLIVLYYMGARHYAGFGILRVFLAAIMWSGFGSAFWISLGGILVSTLVTILVSRFSKASVYGISVCGAIGHGFGQVIAVSIIYETFYMTLYLLVLTISGLITGIIVALLASLLIVRFPKNFMQLNK